MVRGSRGDRRRLPAGKAVGAAFLLRLLGPVCRPQKTLIRSQMDTDSFYFALSGDTREEAVRPELQTEFEACKIRWRAWDKWTDLADPAWLA